MSAYKIKEEWKVDCVGQAAKTASSGTALCSVRQNRSDVQIYLAYSMYPVALRIDRLDYYFRCEEEQYYNERIYDKNSIVPRGAACFYYTLLSLVNQSFWEYWLALCLFRRLLTDNFCMVSVLQLQICNFAPFPSEICYNAIVNNR